MVLDAALLNTQHYEVRINGKVEERSDTLPYTLGVVAIEKGAFGSLSTTVANFTLLYNLVKKYTHSDTKCQFPEPIFFAKI